MSVSRQALGRFGEDVAKNYLVQQGYDLVDTNVRNRMGEIDIVAKDGACLVFVEVRTRRGSSFGTATESVNARKQHRLMNAARYYLTEKRIVDPLCRFDVIGVFVRPAGGQPHIQHIPNAF